MDGGQPATGPWVEGGVLAGRNGVPELGDQGAAVRATGIQNRVGPTERVVSLRILAETAGPAARRLLPGQLDQRVDAGPGNSGDHGTVVGPDPGLGRQAVRNPRPALPLVVERDAGVDHRSPLRQEGIVYRPVEAAGCTYPGHPRAPLDDLGVRTREDAPPVDRRAPPSPPPPLPPHNLDAPQPP